MTIRHNLVYSESGQSNESAATKKTSLGFLAWSVRGFVPDVTAGWQLRAYKVDEVRMDGEQPWQVVAFGLLTTVLSRAGEFRPLRNRKVLEVCLQGTHS